jgi:hypothetical protein
MSPEKRNLRRTEPYVPSFDPLDYWNSLGPGYDLNILKLNNGMRAYRYLKRDTYWSGRIYSFIIREDGKKITHNTP